MTLGANRPEDGPRRERTMTIRGGESDDAAYFVVVSQPQPQLFEKGTWPDGQV